MRLGIHPSLRALCCLNHPHPHLHTLGKLSVYTRLCTGGQNHLLWIVLFFRCISGRSACPHSLK